MLKGDEGHKMEHSVKHFSRIRISGKTNTLSWCLQCMLEENNFRIDKCKFSSCPGEHVEKDD